MHCMIGVYAFNGRTLFNHHFAFFAIYFMALRGFVYTIAAHIYTFRLAFSCILHCI